MTTLIQNAIPDNYLSIDELTEASLDGDGVLDTLLRTMRLHLDHEFKNNRITGTAYATVYAQSLTAFLQQAIQYTLSKSKLALELDGLRAQNQLLITENDKALAEINRIATDTAVAIKQGHLIDAQTHEVNARTNQVNAETGLKLPAEVTHINAQTDLYKQKEKTEKAQIDPSGVLPNSVIDLQNKMMKVQADGFLRDAEQKATKLLVDTWSIRKNSDPDGNPENSTNKLADANIGLAVQKMLQGIGVSV